MTAENKPKITELKELLEKEGFKTTWRNPFFTWLYPPVFGKGEPDLDAGEILYILDPPIPKIGPLDFTTICLMAQDRLLLLFSFFYYKALEGLIRGDDIKRIYKQHASSWFPVLSPYYEKVASHFSLQWDSEYDVYIEDSLYGWEPGRWCKVNLCIWKKSSWAPGKINENESSEFWPEMRKTTALDLDHLRVRNPHPNILIGTASDRYARWIGQIYSEG